MRVLSLLFIALLLSGCYFYIPYETFSPNRQAFALNDELSVSLQFEASSRRFGGWPNKRVAPYTIYVAVSNRLDVEVRRPEDYRYVMVHSLVVTDKLEGKRFDLVREGRIPFKQYSGQRVQAKFIGEREVFKTPYFSPKFAENQELTLNMDIAVVMASGSVRKQIEAKYKAISGVHSGYMY